MTTLIQEPATDGQLKQLSRMAADAAEKAVQECKDLTKDGAQLVHGNPDFAVRVREATAHVIADLSVTDKYKNEEVASNYGYLSGYQQPAGIEEQVDILRSHWRQLNPDAAIRYAREVGPTLQLPDWLEGPFVDVRPGFFSDNYPEELEEVMAVLAKSRDGEFYNFRAKQMGNFRRHAQNVAAYDRIMEQQPDSDLLVVYRQSGIRHRGRSVRRAREVMLGVAGEFGECPKSVGTMLLTNPNRLQHFDDLWSDCPGGEFDDPDAGVRFGHAPIFGFHGDGVKFGTGLVGRALGSCGSASGFVPQG